MAQNTDLSFVVQVGGNKFVNLQDLSGDGSTFFITVNGKYGAAGTDFSCNFWPHTYSSTKIETIKRETHAMTDSSFVYASPTAVKDVSFDMSFNTGVIERTANFTIKQGDKAVSCLPQTHDGSHVLLELYFYNLIDVNGQIYRKMKVVNAPYFEQKISFGSSLLWFDNVSYWDVNSGASVAKNQKLFEFTNGKGKNLAAYANNQFTSAISTKKDGRQTSNCSGTSCKIHVGPSSSPTVSTQPLATLLGHDTTNEKYMLQVYVFKMKAKDQYNIDSRENTHDTLTTGFYATNSKSVLRIRADWKMFDNGTYHNNTRYGYDFGIDLWNNVRNNKYNFLIRGQRVSEHSNAGGCVNTSNIFGNYLVVSYQMNMNHISTYHSPKTADTGYDGILKPGVISTCYGVKGYRNFTSKTMNSQYGYWGSNSDANYSNTESTNGYRSMFWGLKSDNLSSNVDADNMPIINMQNVEQYMARACYARSTEFTEQEMKEINGKYSSHFGINDPAYGWFQAWRFNNRSAAEAANVGTGVLMPFGDKDEASYIEVDCIRSYNGEYTCSLGAFRPGDHLYRKNLVSLWRGPHYAPNGVPEGISTSAVNASNEQSVLLYKFPIPVKITTFLGHCYEPTAEASIHDLVISVCDKDYKPITNKTYTKPSYVNNRRSSNTHAGSPDTLNEESIPTDKQQESQYYLIKHGGYPTGWLGTHVGFK